jgi:hypothetical protein
VTLQALSVTDMPSWRVMYPQIFSTDVHHLICKGVAAQRMTSSASKRSHGGMVRPQSRLREQRAPWAKAWAGQVQAPPRMVVAAWGCQIDHCDETMARVDAPLEADWAPLEEAVVGLEPIPGGAVRRPKAWWRSRLRWWASRTIVGREKSLTGQGALTTLTKHALRPPRSGA